MLLQYFINLTTKAIFQTFLNINWLVTCTRKIMMTSNREEVTSEDLIIANWLPLDWGNVPFIMISLIWREIPDKSLNSFYYCDKFAEDIHISSTHDSLWCHWSINAKQFIELYIRKSKSMNAAILYHRYTRTLNQLMLPNRYVNVLASLLVKECHKMPSAMNSFFKTSRRNLIIHYSIQARGRKGI